jgi:hypothetical protein
MRDPKNPVAKIVHKALPEKDRLKVEQHFIDNDKKGYKFEAIELRTNCALLQWKRRTNKITPMYINLELYSPDLVWEKTQDVFYDILENYPKDQIRLFD